MGVADEELAASLRAALNGDGAAGADFLRRISGIVWTACTILAGDGPEACTAFQDVVEALRADGFSRLGGYKGRGRAETYVAVVTRDLLAMRILRLLQNDRQRGWKAFERFFTADLQRLVRRRLGGPAYEDMRADAYQEICVALVEDDYRRLRLYSGHGSFTGFVLRTADRLLIDFVRSVVSRRRLPAAVARLEALEQDVFRLLAWKGIPPDVESVSGALASAAGSPPRDAVIAAIAAVRLHAREAMENDTARGRVVSVSAMDGEAADTLLGGADISPEDVLTARAEEEALSAALTAMRRAAEGLPDGERIYLDIVLGGCDSLPAREVARLMQRPVEEVYKLKQRVLKRLREAMADDPAVKTWRASVI